MALLEYERRHAGAEGDGARRWPGSCIAQATEGRLTDLTIYTELPRQLTKREKRLLHEYATEAMEELARRVTRSAPPLAA